jgi:hypothetical protein
MLYAMEILCPPSHPFLFATFGLYYAVFVEGINEIFTNNLTKR